MTVEELKKETDTQKKRYISLLKCPTCGKKPKPWVSAVSRKTRYKCECRYAPWCKSDWAARVEWNKMVEEET